MTKIAIGIDFGGTSVKPGVVSGSKIIARSTPIQTEKHLEVIPAELGNDAGIIGGAALAVDAAEHSST